jgi:AsmA protein
MQRPVKIGLAVVVGLVVAVVAIRLLVNANTFRPVLEKQLSTVLGRKVTLGDLRLSVISGSLVANDLSIADDPQFSTTPFLSAKQLRIGVEMKPLIFSRQLIVRSFETDGPEIHFIRAADGRWNFSSLAHGASSRDAAQQTVFPDFTVGEIGIKDGRAVVGSLPAQGQPHVYEHLDVSIQKFSLTKAFPFTVSASVPGDGTVKIAGTAGPLNPQDAAATALDAQVAVKHLDPVVAGFVDPAVGISMLADVDAHAVSDGVNLTSDGKMHADRLVLLKGGVPTPKPVDVSYSVVHSLKGNSGQVHDLAVKTGGVAAHVSGTYNLAGAAPVVNLKLVGQQLPIDGLQALLPAAGVKLPNGSALKGGTLSFSLAIVGPEKDLVISGPIEVNNTQMVNFNLASKLKGVAAMSGLKTGDTTAIQTMRVKVLMSNAGIQLSDIYSVMPALGETSGSGTISPSGQLALRLTAKVTTAQGLGKVGVGLLTKLNGTAGSAATSAAATGVPVIVTGTASNPVITADVSGVMKANANALLGKSKQGLGSFKGLFGKKN